MVATLRKLLLPFCLLCVTWARSAHAAPVNDPLGNFFVTNNCPVVNGKVDCPEPPAVAPNGQVNAIVQAGGLIYIGGTFTNVKPYFGTGVVVDTMKGMVEPPFPRFNGPVQIIIPDGGSGWFVGGEFTVVGTTTRNRIAHINSNKTLDMDWDPNLSGPVRALALSGTKLYIGGDFNTIGGVTRNKIAAVDASTGCGLACRGAVDSSFNPDSKGIVRALAISNDGKTIYAGGEFSSNAIGGQPSIGGAVRNFIAALNTSDGTATGWDAGAGGNSVRALLLDGTTLYVGGGFTTIGGGGLGLSTRNRIAALKTSDGTATSWDPNADGVVFALALAKSSNTVYAGGSFHTMGGTTRTSLAAIDATGAGAVTTWDPNINGNSIIRTLQIVGNLLYAGGGFNTIGGQARNNAAALDTTIITNMATAWDPNINAIVRTIVVGSTAYIGGEFDSAGGDTLRNNLAAFNAITGEVTAANPDPNGPVNALATFGNTVYVGGDFTTLSGGALDCNRIAALTATTGEPSSCWNPGADGSVRALAVSPDGSTVYVGGDFTNIATQARDHIAALTASGLSPWNPGVSGTVSPTVPTTVSALTTTSTKVYVGGSFTKIGIHSDPVAEQDHTNAAFLKGSTGQQIQQNLVQRWNPKPDGPVYAILVGSTTTCTPDTGLTQTVYIGGAFTALNGGANCTGGVCGRKNIAAVKSTSSTPDVKVCNWPADANGAVLALALSGDTLFMGGDFTRASGVSRKHLAAVDVISGTASSWNPNANDSVRALAVSNATGTLYTGGSFSTLAGSTNPAVGLPRNNFAVFSFATLLAITFPLSRSVQVGVPAYAFTYVFNGTPTLATNVSIAPKSSIAGTPEFHFWPGPDPIPSIQDTPVNIPAGGQLFLVGFEPSTPIDPPTEVRFAVEGTNTTAAASISGWNTMYLGASATPTADVFALTSSAGVVIPGPVNSGQALGVAAVNLGVGQTITVLPKGTGNVDAEHFALYICQANPNTGACLAPLASSVNLTFASGATATFGVFVQRVGDLVPCDFVANRLFVEFREGSSTGKLRGVASAFVCTTG